MLNADREEFYKINNVVSTINKFQGEQESEKRDSIGQLIVDLL